jgi:hypothetical protein
MVSADKLLLAGGDPTPKKKQRRSKEEKSRLFSDALPAAPGGCFGSGIHISSIRASSVTGDGRPATMLFLDDPDGAREVSGAISDNASFTG